MAKRAFQKTIRESFKILIKIWINGVFSERDFTVQSGGTVADVRKILTDLYNPTKSARLIMMLPNSKLTSKMDSNLISSLSGFTLTASRALTIHAIFKPGNFENSLATIPESSEVYKYLNVIQILNRNAKTCAQDARQNNPPKNRERFNAPEEPVAKRPKIADFAKCTSDVSETLFELSKSMKILSNQLEKDSGNFPDAMDTKMSRLLENNIDTCRYLAPLLQSLSSISVPLSGKSGNAELTLKIEPKPISGANRMFTRKAL
jgi:hypothetical protein